MYIISSKVINKRRYMNKLREVRKSKGYSQEGLAMILKFEQSQLSDYERELITPSLFRAIKIAKALGVTVEDIWMEGE